jgi:methionyl-tRNA formyltransferase
MKVIFIGASNFGLKCLDRVRRLGGFEIAGIITNMRQFSISYAPEGVDNVLYADFKDYARIHGIPVYTMTGKMTEPGLTRCVRSWTPDMFIVAGWYHMIPRSLRTVAPAFALHASLLPDYSGGAPLVWAMINGEKKTGITLFECADGVDNGRIVGQESTGIFFEDTIGTLYERIESLGLKLLEEYLPRIAAGSAVFVPQDESRRRVFPQRKPEDGRIDWRQPAQKIHDFIRAQTRPYPGAFTTFDAKDVHIWDSEHAASSHRQNESPGFVYMSSHKKIIVNCGMRTALGLKSVGTSAGDMPAEYWFSNFMNKAEGFFV